MDDYITYLSNLAKELYGCLSPTEPQNLLTEKKPKIRSIPETQKTQLHQDLLLGNTAKLMSPNYLVKYMFQTLNQRRERLRQLRQSPCKVREFNVRGVYKEYQVSLNQSDRLWISDNAGYLVQIDLQRDVIQKLQTSGKKGYHTLTQDGNLIFTDRNKNVINRIT
ncbi:uncharacterized protein LOC134228547 [Saccostrea cucullata]|uniref:uncharacterized protein LOC134228547 n=1 Tax=Saccostrea cuccullata TaxID=36930 RepID=UPI002ED3C06B